jgi:BON domain-containing protein
MQRMTTLTAALAGAALMFFLDPITGRRRRALARDQFTRGINRAGRFSRAAARDIANRATGIRAGRQPRVVSDDVLRDRVKTRLGRVVSHPGAVHVMVERGVVRLDGAVLADELKPLFEAITGVDGVREIDNRLLVSEHGEHIPGLQGAGTPPRHKVRHLMRAPGVQLASVLALAVPVAAIVLERSSRDRSRVSLPA